MKKILILCSIFCVLFQLDANCCKRKKKKKAAQAEQAKVNSSSLVVSFVSFGSGIDYKAIPGFEQQITDFNKKNNCQIEYTKFNWGREGEVDYCFTTNATECLEKLISSLQLNYSKNDRILIKQNAKCKN